jgi:hypothetical protein
MRLCFFFSYLRGLFRKLFCQQGFEYDYEFDWKIQKMKELNETHSGNSEGQPPVVNLE